MTYDYSRADFTELEFFFLDNSFKDYFLLKEVNSLWFSFKSVFFKGCSIFIPTIKKRPKSTPPWFNSNIRHHIKCIKTLKRSLAKTSTQTKMFRLSCMESDLQALIQSSKLEYEQHLINTFHSNSKKLFNHLKSMSTQKSCIGTIIHNSSPVTDPTHKAELFNNYFNSTFTKSTFVLPPTNQLPTPSSQLSSIEITCSDVFDAFCSLNTAKSPGCDNISPKVLVRCCTSLLDPISHLFSLCLHSSSIPKEWKVHKIIPIPKKGDLSEVSNYRPISLLCILSKMLESVVYNKIFPFLQPLICHQQFGFVEGRSTLNQLMKFLADIYHHADNKNYTDAIYFDFKKAFDTVPHNELLYKLWMLGITGPLWHWFKNYLSNRNHFVSVENSSSSTLPVISGVPQGSVLGPLLFLIYVNDIPSSIHKSSVYLFADDTKISKVICNLSDSLDLQSDIDSLLHWCLRWNMSIHSGKCVAIRFGHSLKDSPSYSTNNTTIQPSTKHRDLGLILSSDLSWSSHYNHISRRAYFSLYLIRRSFSTTLPIHLKKHLYLSLVRSHLTYCSQIWRPRHLKDILCLERIQRRATKYILSDSHSDYKSRLISLQLLPLMYWFDLQDVLFLVKCLKDESDNMDIHNYITFVSSSTRSSTCNKLKHNLSRTSTTRHFYFNRVVLLWNALPSIDLSLSIPTIKKQVILHLWNHFTRNYNLDNPCSLNFICPCNNCYNLSRV